MDSPSLVVVLVLWAALMTVSGATCHLLWKHVNTPPPSVKPSHRHRFVFRAEERTNKVRRRIHTCEETGCSDAWIDEVSEGVAAS